MVNRFSPDGVIGEMDCFYAQWMTDREGGFSDDDIAALQRLTPFLGLAIKSASLARIAETLVETYLGRDAGRRVLSGRIARGVADRIDTVLWFSDLRDYTRIADSSAARRHYSAARRLHRRDCVGDPRQFGRRAEADRRWGARDIPHRATQRGLRRGA